MRSPAFHELADVLNFTEADLSANREGYITERQFKQLRMKCLGMSIAWGFEVLWAMGFIALSLIFLLVGLTSPFRSLGNFLSLLPGIVLAGGMGTFLFYISATHRRRRWLAYRHDLKAGVVNQVEGQLIKTKRKNRNTWWTIQICDENLPINQKIFPCFEQGKFYRVYFTSHTRIILSAEFSQDTI